MIESMDEALGDVLDYLEVNQIENKTVILFMSDNGGLSAEARGGEKHMHNIPLKSGKGSIYEGGIRVPMLAYWPNKTKPETINPSSLIIEDFFPSILDIAQVNVDNLPQTVDGQSFIPQLLRDDVKSVKDRPLFWHYPNEWGPEGPGIGSYSAVRQGDWKLIYFHTKKTLELYNLKEDIQENFDLSISNHEKVKQLAITLTKYLKKVDAQMPVYKSTKQKVPWPTSILVSIN
jgi:arylsulfatase A-like enzyme